MDPYQSPDEQAPNVIEAMVGRLEDRGGDDRFNGFIDRYVERVEVSDGGLVVDVGCGTGVVTRRLAGQLPGEVRITGVDISERLLEVARPTADERTDYLLADAGSIPLPDGCAELVVMHTLVSHVPDPAAILREGGRLLAPGGTLVVFDADYASTTYAIGDFERGGVIDRKLLGAVVHNLDVCRRMPRIIREAGLELVDHEGHLISEAGRGDFWLSSVRGFEKLIPALGILPDDEGRAWVEEMIGSHEDGTFFASGNYYTYYIRRS